MIAEKTQQQNEPTAATGALRDIISVNLDNLVRERRRLMQAPRSESVDDWRAMLDESCAAVSIDGCAWLQATYHDRVEYTSEAGATVVVGHQETDPAVVTTGTVARYLASQGGISDPVALDNVLLRMALAGRIASPQPGRWLIAS